MDRKDMSLNDGTGSGPCPMTDLKILVVLNILMLTPEGY
jgi:hypothetical protein